MTTSGEKISRYIRKVYGPELARIIEAEPGSVGEADAREIIAKLPALIAAIGAALRQAEAKVQLASRSLEISSRELFAANSQLLGTNNQVRAILDLMDQAILVFDRDGICLPVFSRSCGSVIGGVPGGRHIAEILQLGPSDTAAFTDWLRLLFGGSSSHEILLELLPKRLPTGDGRMVELEFRPVHDADGRVAQVMMIATDRTEELRKAALLEHEHCLGQRIIAIVSNRTGFRSYLAMLDRAKAMILSIDPERATESQVAECKILLHGLKALSACFYAGPIQRLMHRFENEIGLAELSFFAAREEKVRELADCVREHNQEIEALLGADFIQFEEFQGVRIRDIQRFRELLSEDSESSGRLEQFDALISNVPLESFCTRYVRMAENVAQALGKRILPLKVEVEGDLRVNIARMDRFLAALSHLISNAIDHGIESPADRIVLGKPERGVLCWRVAERTIEARRMLVFRISDDGRGIDIAEIGRLAGLPSTPTPASPEELFELLLMGVSTKVRVDVYSGRGLGIKALRSEIQALSGTALVRTERGKGTEFEIRIPV